MASNRLPPAQVALASAFPYNPPSFFAGRSPAQALCGQSRAAECGSSKSPHGRKTVKTEDRDFMSQFVMVLSGLVLIAVVIFFIARLVTQLTGEPTEAEGPDKMARQAVEERIEPVGEVATASAKKEAAQEKARSPQKIVKNVCQSCHGPGTLGAPKLDSKGDWEPRMDKGLDTLVKHAVNGFKQMPAKGGDPSLSKEEVRKSVVYMVEQAGLEIGGEKVAKAEERPAKEEQDGKSAEAQKGKAAELEVASREKGEQLYQSACSACHDTGAAGAPKLGEQQAWKPRLKKDRKTLYQSAINGMGAMPPKGGQANASDAAVRAAVDYMVDQAAPSDGDAATGQKGAEQKGEGQAAAQQPEDQGGGPEVASLSKGRKLYGSACASCHDTGAAGAPKLDNPKAWEPRLQQGRETLYHSAINGKGAMPPKGGYMGEADAVVRAAVDYMLQQVQQ